ncbi:MAG: hypothetical protein OEV00_12090, partial [Acidobacteriota bacterium]|nr:hypothetical protein [Acidobacteriota bacterium]
QAAWREVLISPEMEKVSNDPDVEVRLVTVEWNQAIELGDSNAVYFWSVDTDTSSALPVDIKRDGGALNAGGGSYGAVSGGGNPALSDGYSMFTTLDPGTRQSINGTVGNNREGKSSCYFEDPLAIALDTLQDDLGLAGPEDDDINNRYCIDAPNRSCTSNADCSDLTDTTCAAATGITDDYVAKNGPARNADLNDWNGLDMRFFTLEDVFGPTGDTWETAIGLSVFEKLSPSDSDPVADFGLAVDDWNVEWKEVSLTVDNTTCTTGGDCAVLDLDTFQFFEGNSLVSITLLERSPSVNDCNDDGDYIDAEDDFNCDNDATNDVRVKVTSEAEIEGEFVNLELTSAACNCEYRGQIAVSVSYDVDPGVLFLQQSGTDPPTVTVTYDDRFDGISGPCDNSIDPEANGLVQAATPVFITTGNVQVLDYALVDNQPLNDGWADTNETVDMFLTIGNKTGVPLTGVSARLQTNDPKIDCVTKPFIEIGDFEEGETRITPVPFTFHVSPTANRAGEFEEFTSDFQIILESDQLLAPTFPQTLTIDLDLSASGGSAPAIFFDGFEGAVEVADSLFEIDNIDSTLFGPVPSDGFRCQYSDPDYVNSNSYGQIDDCWVGSSGTAAAAVNWWINTTANPNGGRGYSGDQSLYYGVDPEDVAFDAQTTRLAVIEAVQTTDPINIGWDTVCSLTRTTICANDGNCPGGETCVPVAPTLSFKHQISVMDSRSVNVNAGESADRGVISVQLADGAGVGSGNWIKITPFDNVYDQQGTDNYQECLFDPTDDGTTEDDFFDPTDPNRRLGPSSTCFPSLSFVFLGDTFEQNSFAELNLGNASDGPGLLGNNGAGTWVESKFSLQRFRGRRIRTRFLLSSIKVGGTETYEAAFDFNPDPGDDGWWIDDVTITDTLTNAATVIVDNDDNSALPGCGINCSGVIAGLTVDPAGVIPAPGQAVEVTADTSSATACLDGVLQFRYSIDLNGDDMSGGPGELFRDWTDNPDLLQAPTATTTYVVDVRCSNQTPTLCQDSAAIEVVVTCPSTGTLTSGFPDITATDVNTLVWSPATLGTYAKGLDATLSSYTPSGTGGVVGTSHDMTPDNPVSGEFYWYLIRDNAGGSGPACNVSGSGFVWGNAARDASPNLP